MMNALKILIFTIAVVLFYSYVGQMVPQKITYPPEDTEIGADLSTGEMVTIGEEIVGGKGTCLTCHTMGSHDGALRFPDLGNIGAVAGSRKEGTSDVEYLAESLYDPNAFIVEGFTQGMPTIHKAPINLSDDEILTVISYLQSLGGTPSVTMATELEWQGQAPAADASAAPAATVASNMDGPTIFTTYLCNTCHSIDNPAPLVGPSLYDVGARLTKAEITDALLEPDAVVAEGFPGGVMKGTLDGVGFYDKVSAKDLNTLVDYLASHKGE